MPPRSAAAVDYQHLEVPLPLATSERVGRNASKVWSAIHTRLLYPSDEEPLPARYLEETLGLERAEVEEAIGELRELSLLEVGETETAGIVEYRLLWPDWIAEEGKRFLREEVLYVED